MDYLAKFEQYLYEDGKSTSTILSYTRDIKGFLNYLKQNGHEFDGNLARFHVTSFKQELEAKDFKYNTINKKINSLVSFNQFLIDKGVMQRLIVDLKKDKIRIAYGSEQEVEVYTENEVERLLFFIQDESKVTIRDKLIIYILLYTGIRVSELVSIKLKDIDLLTLQIKINGKGGKIREVPLRAEVVEEIKYYLETERRNHKFNQSEYLLLTERSGKMDRDAVNKLLNKYGKALEIKMKPHKFRHTFCTRLLKAGVPLSTISKLAGHSSIQTTVAFYVTTSRQDKLDAVDLL